MEKRAITDEVPEGTITTSSSITDATPDVYVHGAAENLSPSEQAERIADTQEPEETLKEYLDRHDDE